MNTCGECGEPIYWRDRSWAGMDGGDRWYHAETHRVYCYRAPEHTEMAYPAWAPEPRRTSPSVHVIGFQVQCQICPQKAILTDQVDAWVCPRCTEVGEPAEDPTISSAPSAVIPIPIGRQTWRIPCRLIDGVWYPSGPATLVEERPADDPGFGDVDVAQAEPVEPPTYPWGEAIPDPYRLDRKQRDDDGDYPIGQVQG